MDQALQADINRSDIKLIHLTQYKYWNWDVTVELPL
jgi:hypothetical protein